MEKDDLIVYLHGFRSSADSSKVKILKEMFPESQIEGLNYHPHRPSLASKEIEEFALENADKEILFLGTSLGGFWARWAACKFSQKSLLINPSLHPDETLKAGQFQSHKEPANYITVNSEDIKAFNQFKVSPHSCSHATVLLAMDDEILDAKKTAKELEDCHNVICFDKGGHRFSQFKEMKSLIEGELNWMAQGDKLIK